MTRLPLIIACVAFVIALATAFGQRSDYLVVDQSETDGGLSAEIRSDGGNTCCFVSAHQENPLNERNDCQQSCEDSQYKRVKDDRIVPSPLPNNRKALPQGFGWVLLFGFCCGGLIGGGLMLLYWRLWGLR